MTATKLCRLDDSRSIRYREQGSGPVLVLLHGWGMSSMVFGPLMERLAPSYRTLAPDLPGHGGSAPGAGYELVHMAEAVHQWLGRLEVREIHMLGWSLGGMLALEMARQQQIDINKLILIATTPCFVQRDAWSAGQPVSQVNILARQYKRNPTETLGGFFRSQFAGEGLPESEVDRCQAELLSQAPMPHSEAALCGLETLCHTDLRDMPWPLVPSLVLHGTEDKIIPPAAGHYLSCHLPDARWVLLDGAGHAPFISQRERCARLFEDFLG